MTRLALLTVLVAASHGCDEAKFPDAGPAPAGKLERQAGVQSDRLGAATALSATTLIVGAPGHDAPRPTADGDTDEVPDAGRVFIYDLSGTASPAEIGELDLGAAARWGDEFGRAVALSGDTLVVGAPGADLFDDTDDDAVVRDTGAVFVYSLEGTTSTLSQELRAPDGRAGDRFGSSVSLIGDRLVVGAENSDGVSSPEPQRDTGAVYLYTRTADQFALDSF